MTVMEQRHDLSQRQMHMIEAVEHLGAEQPTSPVEDIRFSYSRPEQPWWQRALIRTVERLSGQPGMERLYRSWSAARPEGENIFAAGVRLLGFSIDTNLEGWAKVPRSGPVLFVANHPFGVADGLMLGDLVTRVRPDAKIMTHSLLCQPPEARDFLLPVDFGGTKEAQTTSVLTRRRTMDWLNAGHAVMVFPAGGVATAQKPLTGPALDLPWHPFIARLSRVRGLTVVPVYFHGQNSRLFQIASHLHYLLRVGLVFHETARRVGARFKVTVGDPVAASHLNSLADRNAVVDDLRRRTVTLGGAEAPLADAVYQWPSYVASN